MLRERNFFRFKVRLYAANSISVCLSIVLLFAKMTARSLVAVPHAVHTAGADVHFHPQHVARMEEQAHDAPRVGWQGEVCG
jgi:hypothetical protein